MDSLFFRVTCIFLECVEDNGVVVGVGIFLVEQDVLYARVEYLLDILLFNHSLTVENNVVTLDRNYFTGILIGKVLYPCLEHTGCQLAAYGFFQVGLVHFEFLSKSENLNDVLIALKTDCTQQCGHGQLLLAVDVGIHHIVNVGCELNP